MKTWCSIALGLAILSSVAQADTPPIRTANARVRMQRYVITKTTTGFHIDFNDVCERSVQVGVYDGRGAGGIILPSDPAVACETTRDGQQAYAAAQIFVILQRGTQFQNEEGREVKNFTTQFFAEKADGNFIGREFNLSSGLDIHTSGIIQELALGPFNISALKALTNGKLKAQDLKLSPQEQILVGEKREGYLIAVEIQDPH